MPGVTMHLLRPHLKGCVQLPLENTFQVCLIAESSLFWSSTPKTCGCTGAMLFFL